MKIAPGTLLVLLFSSPASHAEHRHRRRVLSRTAASSSVNVADSEDDRQIVTDESTSPEHGYSAELAGDTRRINAQRQTQQAWPHYLTLLITFDSLPQELSWKFENQRTSKILAGVPFEEYSQEYANQQLSINLDILTEEDYDGDWMGSQSGALRYYRFVAYDRGANGLCCKNGNGKYEIYSKNALIASGANFGAIDEHFFEIDPRVYLGDDGGSGGLPVNNNNNNMGDVRYNYCGAGFDDANSRCKTMCPNGMDSECPDGETCFADATSCGGSSGNGLTPPTPEPTPPPMLPTLLASFFCGTSYDDAEENCSLPCPTGSPAECAKSDIFAELRDDEYSCWASTTCRERYETPGPTNVPTLKPTKFPTETPTVRCICATELHLICSALSHPFAPHHSLHPQLAVPTAIHRRTCHLKSPHFPVLLKMMSRQRSSLPTQRHGSAALVGIG